MTCELLNLTQGFALHPWSGRTLSIKRCCTISFLILHQGTGLQRDLKGQQAAVPQRNKEVVHLQRMQSTIRSQRAEGKAIYFKNMQKSFCKRITAATMTQIHPQAQIPHSLVPPLYPRWLTPFSLRSRFLRLMDWHHETTSSGSPGSPFGASYPRAPSQASRPPFVNSDGSEAGTDKLRGLLSLYKSTALFNLPIQWTPNFWWG